MLYEKIENIELQITRKCNMHCTYCSNDDGGIDNNSIVNLDYIEVIKQLPNLKKITLTGGEPSISEESVKLLERISKEAKDNDILLQLNTNGLVNDKKKWNGILNLFDIIHFSATNTLDKKLFSKIRGVKEISFDTINRNIEYAHSFKDIKTVIEILVGKFNLEELFSLYEFYRYRVDEIQIQPIIINGRAAPEMQVDSEELSIAIKKIIKRNKIVTDTNVKLKLWCVPFLCQSIILESDNIDCECGLNSIYVTDKGLVLPCNVAFYPDSNSDMLTPISLKENSIQNILTNSKFYNHLHNNYSLDFIRKNGLCKMVKKREITE